MALQRRRGLMMDETDKKTDRPMFEFDNAKGQHVSVFFRHERQDPGFWDKPENSSQTICDVKIGSESWFGIASCHHKDNFCKSKGRKLALARAMEFVDKEIR